MADGGATPSESTAVRPKVYVDTSVPSYLTSKRTRAMPMGRHQLVTCLWWNAHRSHFKLYVSTLVLREAGEGDPEAAQRRTEVISPLQSLEITAAATGLAALIMRQTQLPPRAEADAKHIAIAATHGIDFLVTWNCKHLANPAITPKVASACELAGFRSPQICTPEDIIRRVIYARPAVS